MNDAPALLVVDVQRGYFTGTPGLYRPDHFLDVVAGLVDRARAEAVPVVYTRYMGEQGNMVEVGTPAFEIHDRLTPDAVDLVVDKRSTDSFHDSGLHDLLRGLGVGHLYVVGCLSELCVDTTCRRAVGLGYRTTLVADGHATVDAPLEGVPPGRRAALMNRVLSRVGTAEQMIGVRSAAEIDFLATNILTRNQPSPP